MTVVKIIDMVLMPNGDMAAARTVRMRLIGEGHGFSFRVCCVSPPQRTIGSVSDEIEGPSNTISWHLDAPATRLLWEPNLALIARTSYPFAMWKLMVAKYRFGSWLCENSETRNRDRTNISSKPRVQCAKIESVFSSDLSEKKDSRFNFLRFYTPRVEGVPADLTWLHKSAVPRKRRSAVGM
jgi:hypothetical protein